MAIDQGRVNLDLTVTGTLSEIEELTEALHGYGWRLYSIRPMPRHGKDYTTFDAVFTLRSAIKLPKHEGFLKGWPQ